MSPLYHRALSIITLLPALGCAVIGGTFFAFSTFVMPALARLPASQGIGAMQSINVVVLNRWFLGVFLGTALACVVFSVASSVRGPAWLSIAGSLLYLVGSLGITTWFNVPLNDKLATIAPDAPDAAAMWTAFVTEWTRWNTIRSLASLAAAALLVLALVERARSYPGSCIRGVLHSGNAG